MIKYYAGLPFLGNNAIEKRIALQGYDAERLWRNMMLWCLKYQKKQALLLLVATFRGRKYRPPRYVVADCLESLARYFLFQVSQPNPTAVDVIWFLTRKLIEGASDQEQSFPIPQHLVYLILKHSDDSRVVWFYGLLGLNKIVLHSNTMLHFLDRFLDMGMINLSMKLLDTITKTNFNLSLDRIQMACVKLLRARFDTQEEYTLRSNVLTQILEMGIKPKIPMLNAILLNAGEGRDFANAWKMFGLAKENALIPDSITYGVLLKGAILSGESFNIEMVMREIQTNREVLQDLRLVSDVLMAMFLISPKDAFFPMLDFYKQHCDLRPLQELSMCGDDAQAQPGADCSGVWPTSYILTHMILAYIRSHQGTLGLVHKYNLYYQHVKENHPLIAPLAQNDIVANSFVMAFGMESGTLQHCTTVVKDMVEFSSSQSTTVDSVPYATPTVQTWSILVAAYFRNRQKRAAEKVLDLMRERGIKGDKVTWNTLVSGYAGLQDVSAAVDTVKAMKANGFEVDDFTIKGLGRLLARDRLSEALKTSTEQPSSTEGSSQGFVPPLGPEEAKVLNGRILSREAEVEKYLKAEDQQQQVMDMGRPNDRLGATAQYTSSIPCT